MRAVLCSGMAGALLISSLHAIPNTFIGNGFFGPVIPATPRFNADLTEEFFEVKNWKTGEFSGPWEDEPSLPELKVRRMAAVPIVLGEIPMSVYTYSNSREVTEIAIHFLDAGIFFGYQAGGEQDREARTEGRTRRSEFGRHFKRLSRSLEERLEEGCGRGKTGTIGRTAELRTSFREYRWEDFVIRLGAREDHSVSVHLYRKGQEPRSLVEQAWSEADRRDRQELLEARVSRKDSSSVQLAGLPMFTQGSTPFCGIHSLAMAGHYLGLRTSPEALAAAADFSNTGSARGSDMIEVHRAVAGELGIDLAIAPKLDSKRLTRSLEDGLPVIVWRRVSPEREKTHARIAKARRESSDTRYPPLTEEDRAAWPERDLKGSPSHSSIVVGIDQATGLVNYLDPWGEVGLDRIMTIEELEATTYAAFHFRL
ncbi:MAG: hypothetical protein AAGC68_08575 [Verrucomicrobiota bacterium]